VDLEEIFRTAITRKASDILFTVGSPAILRVYGELLPLNSPIYTSESLKKMLYGLLAEDQVVRFEREKELDFGFWIKDLLRFRGNLFLQRGSLGACFRIITEEIPSLEALGLPVFLKELVLLSQGLILVTGPTGHGKSTTLACLVDLINAHQKKHVITIEDPIEYLHKAKYSIIEQREVGQDTHSFAQALKHVLRQDPDVILIGEMRDLETVSAALTAAETGHLVLATLHTNDAVQSIDRLVDVFPSHQQNQIRSQLALALTAVLSQRLLKKAEGEGQQVVVEILLNNPGVRNLIRENKTHQIYSLMETHQKEGMVTLDSRLKELYSSGIVNREEAKRHLRNPRAFL
jgi:twitching motility protein PilT